MDALPAQNSYFRETRTVLYSYLICLPLLLLYEILIQISQPDVNNMVRISVDAWFKSVLATIGLDGLSVTLILVILAGLFILIRDRHKLKEITPAYFLFMLLESVAYAVILAIFISSFLQAFLVLQTPMQPDDLSNLQLLALSLGAGLYEELFYRVILVSLTLFLFKKYFTKTWVAYSAAAITAALIFSAAHYLGEFGDTFTTGSFLFRFLFGLALNVIYVLRGFGMAAWTHAIYDILVISIR